MFLHTPPLCIVYFSSQMDLYHYYYYIWINHDLINLFVWENANLKQGSIFLFKPE